MFLHSFFIKYVICCSCHFRSLQHHIWKKYIYINAQSILGYVVTWRIQPVDPSNRVKEGCIFWPHLKEPLKWDNVDALLWRSQSSNAAFEGCDTWIETQPWCSLIYLKRTRELSAQTESPVFFFLGHPILVLPYEVINVYKPSTCQRFGLHSWGQANASLAYIVVQRSFCKWGWHGWFDLRLPPSKRAWETLRGRDN